MANLHKAIIIRTWAVSDNRNITFTLDLTKDPYWIGTHTTSGIGGSIQNWTTNAAAPFGVIVVAGADSATLVGSIITITVPLKPVGFLYSVTLNVLFV